MLIKMGIEASTSTPPKDPYKKNGNIEFLMESHVFLFNINTQTHKYIFDSEHIPTDAFQNLVESISK